MNEDCALELFSDTIDFGNSDGINIGLGVLGSSMVSSKMYERWSGQAEYFKILRLLCKQTKINKVFLLGKSSITPDAMKFIDPDGKVVDVFNKLAFKDYIDKDTSFKTDEEKFEYYKKYYTQLFNYTKKNNIRIDVGLFFTSQGAFSRGIIPGYLTSSKKSCEGKRINCLGMTIRYAAPIADYLNMSNIPWFMIATDPRYIKNDMYPLDFKNLPREIIGQKNETLTWKHITNYPNDNVNFERVNMKHTFNNIEKMNLMFEEIKDPSSEKEHDLIIVAKQVESKGTDKTKDFRYNSIKKWILDVDGVDTKHVPIYGYWDEDRKEGYPQFKGYFKDTKELDALLTKTKYTVVFATRAGWATSKPWEMLVLGIVPFFTSEYDTQNNMIPDNHPVRCKTPQELFKKIEYLNSHDDERIRLVLEMQNTYLNGVKDGSYFIDMLNKKFSEHGIKVQL